MDFFKKAILSVANGSATSSGSVRVTQPFGVERKGEVRSYNPNITAPHELNARAWVVNRAVYALGNVVHNELSSEVRNMMSGNEYAKNVTSTIGAETTKMVIDTNPQPSILAESSNGAAQPTIEQLSTRAKSLAEATGSRVMPGPAQDALVSIGLVPQDPQKSEFATTSSSELALSA